MKNRIKNFLLDIFIFTAFYLAGIYVSESYQSGWVFGSLAIALSVMVDRIRELNNKCKGSCKNNLEKTCTIKKD